jgi:hypothetical protein
VRAMLWPLLSQSAWAQPATRVAGTTVEGAALASVLLVGVGSASHKVGGQDRLRHCSGLCSLGRLGHNQPLGWHRRKVRALLWSLFAWSGGIIEPLSWRARQMRGLDWLLFAQVAWAHQITLASVRRGLSHCGGGPIGKGVGLVSPLFLRSAWAQSLWWSADRQGCWSGLASFPLVGVGSVTVLAGR